MRHAYVGPRRQQRDHARAALGQARPPRAARVDRGGRAPVRLLPAGPDHVGRRAPGRQALPDGRGHRRRNVGQHLPLRDVPAHPGRDPSSRGPQEGRRVMNALITRRALLRGGLAVGAGLTVGFPVARGARGAALAQTAGVFAPNQWLRIDRDGVVTIVNSVPEMGQGSLTTTSMIIADELDAILDQVRVEQAPANPALYKNPVTGTQSYGGSRGVRDHLAMWRKAAAAAREMLAQAAADEWGVPVESVETEQGAVVHRPSGRRLLYGQLVDRAQQVPVPQNPTLKSPDKFRYIGKPVKRRDTPEKITGRGIYGTDVQVPGMLVASIERCPVFGGKVKSFDATAATRVKGVKHVVQVSNGIAVVADGFWTALQGRRALRVTWDEGPMAQVSSTMITREYEAAAKQPGQVARNDGDAEKVLAAGGRVHEAVYQVPFLEHAARLRRGSRGWSGRESSSRRGARRPAPSTRPRWRPSGTCPTTSRTSASNGPTRTSASRSGSGARWARRKTGSSSRASSTSSRISPARIRTSTGARCSASRPATRRCSSWRPPEPTGGRRCQPAIRAASPWRSPTAAMSPTWPRCRWPGTAPSAPTGSSPRSMPA